MRFIILACALLVPIVGTSVSEGLAIVIAAFGVVVFELYLVSYTRAVACLVEHLGEETAESRECSYELLADLDNRFVAAFGAAAGPSIVAYRLQKEPPQIKARLRVIWKPLLPKDEDGDDDRLVWMPCGTRMICFRHFYNAFQAWLLVHGFPHRADPLERLAHARNV